MTALAQSRCSFSYYTALKDKFRDQPINRQALSFSSERGCLSRSGVVMRKRTQDYRRLAVIRRDAAETAALRCLLHLSPRANIITKHYAKKSPDFHFTHPPPVYLLFCRRRR